MFLAILKDDLSSVQFLRDGVVVDPCAVLTALAAGMLTVKHERVYGTIGDNMAVTSIAKYIKSETWTLVPTQPLTKAAQSL